MSSNKKRIPVKWVRDAAKSAYQKSMCCYICSSTENLELHHLNSVSLLLEKWLAEKGISIENDEDILAVRQEFIRLHHKELYIQVYTLCAEDHAKLHKVYGVAPGLDTVEKQANWIKIQKEKKNNNKDSVEKISFSEFC